MLEAPAPEGDVQEISGGFDPAAPLPPPPPGSTGAHPPYDDPMAVPGAEGFHAFDPAAPVDEPLSAAEIDRLARESVRSERMSKRPRLLRRVFDHEDD